MGGCTPYAALVQRKSDAFGVVFVNVLGNNNAASCAPHKLQAISSLSDIIRILS
jgi:hypothetical protein